MKIIDPINIQTFELREAISNLLSARLYVGQTLYFTFRTINETSKRHKYTLAQFLIVMNISFPRLSRRTLLRCYNVFNRLVIEGGFWISEL